MGFQKLVLTLDSNSNTTKINLDSFKNKSIKIWGFLKDYKKFYN